MRRLISSSYMRSVGGRRWRSRGRTWFGRPENVQQFVASYDTENIRWGRQMSLQMILVFGRRAEFESAQELAAQRASLLPGEGEKLLSYDRVSPDPSLGETISVRTIGSGRYKALYVSPMFCLGPKVAERLLCIEGIEEALRLAPLISEGRRKFLIHRIPYWRDWAKSSKHGRMKIFKPNDTE